MPRARLIYNPTAGRELMSRKLPVILQKLEKAGYETSTHATEGYMDAKHAAAKAVDSRFDLIIAAGGDGTVYEVINGIAERDHRPALGILPAGTSNDFANSLGLPKDIDEACDIIASGYTSPFDIGKVNKQYFINIAGGGTLTELTYEVPSKWKTMLGQLAYYVKGVEKLALLKPTRMKIESKEVTLDEEVMMFLIANSRTIGGLQTIVPDADMQDGYFDVLVVKKTSLPEFLKLASQAFRGSGHLQDEHVIHFRTAELAVLAEQKVQVNLDGELGCELPCTFKVLHKHIRICIPQNEA